MPLLSDSSDADLEQSRHALQRMTDTLGAISSSSVRNR